MTIRFAIYLGVICLAFLNGAWAFKKLSPAFKILCIFMGISFLSEVLSRIFITNLMSSMPIYHVYSLVQYACFALIFSYLFIDPKLKKLMHYSIFPMVVVGILNTVFLQSFTQFPSNFLIAMFFIFICCVLIVFKQLFEEDEQVLIKKRNVFYFSGALLIYTVVVLSNFGLTNYFIRHKIDNRLSRDIVYYVTLLFYSTIGLTFTLDRTNWILNDSEQ